MEKTVTDEVVLVIQGEEEASKENKYYDTSNDPSRIPISSFDCKSPKVALTLHQEPLIELDSPKSTFPGQPSPGTTNFSPAFDKPTKILSGTPTSKPKPRSPELPILASLNPIDEKKSTLMKDLDEEDKVEEEDAGKEKEEEEDNEEEAEEEEEEEEEEEIYKCKDPEKVEDRRKKLNFWVSIEWIALICFTGTLISSLTIEKLENFKILELHLWKWCELLLVSFCGRLFAEWFVINGLVFLIERNFLLKKKVLYYVYGLKKSVQICVWFGLVLLSWVVLFNGRIKRSDHTNKIMNYVTRALITFWVGAIIWLIKNTFIKMLAASAHVNVGSFFDRIQESIFHQYVIQTLSGPPLMELAENIGRSETQGHLSFRSVKEGMDGDRKEVIDVDKLQKVTADNVSSWTMKLLSNVIRATKLSIISNKMEELYDEGEERDLEINSKTEAKAAADQIFKNVVKRGRKYIYEDDLLRFLMKGEVDSFLSRVEGAIEAGKIKKSMLTNWLVKVYLERKSLARSLDDAKIAVEQLNKVVSILVFIMFVIVWLISMGLATTEVLLFIASQIVIFGNTTKAVFEGIIFVFLTHPFVVGDRCVIDGVQMIVEEINIMRTGFLRSDNEKIFYPNSVLATKTIANMHRSSSGSSPFTGDTVEFAVDASTTVESIGALKARIKTYIERNPRHWNPNHTIVVLEIAESKLKMALHITHTIKRHNMGEKINRRSNLVLELKKIFEELSIKYDILPQEIPASFAV